MEERSRGWDLSGLAGSLTECRHHPWGHGKGFIGFKLVGDTIWFMS